MKNVRHSSSCDSGFGTDDSIDVDDQPMKGGNLRFPVENTCDCGNVDVDSLIFEECQQSGKPHLTCLKCGLRKDVEIVPTDNDAMHEDTEDRALYDDTLFGDHDLSTAWPSFDDQFPHQSQEPSACECGNEESDLFEKAFDASGNSVISVRYLNCDRERKPWTSEANHSFVECNTCGNNTGEWGDLYEKTIDRSGKLVGVFCCKCETLITVKDSKRPTKRIASSESLEPTQYICKYETGEFPVPDDAIAPDEGQPFEPLPFDSYRKPKLRGDSDARKRRGGIYSLDGGIFSHNGAVVGALSENEQNVLPRTVTGERTGEYLEPDERLARVASLSSKLSPAVCYTKTKVTSLRTLKPGDQIAWKRCGGIYYHHAILVEVLSEKELNVIHNTVLGRRGVKCKIIKGNKQVDLSKGDLYLCNYKSGECLEPDVVIARAENQLGVKIYNPFLSNCEHFATFCKTTKSFSNQVASLTNVGMKVIGQLLIPVPVVGYLIGRTIGDVLRHFIERKTVISCLEPLLCSSPRQKRQGICIAGDAPFSIEPLDQNLDGCEMIKMAGFRHVAVTSGSSLRLARAAIQILEVLMSLQNVHQS